MIIHIQYALLPIRPPSSKCTLLPSVDYIPSTPVCFSERHAFRCRIVCPCCHARSIGGKRVAGYGYAHCCCIFLLTRLLLALSFLQVLLSRLSLCTRRPEFFPPNEGFAFVQRTNMSLGLGRTGEVLSNRWI